MKALVVLLVGCGFQGSPPGVTPPIDAAPDPFQDAAGTGADAAPANKCYGPGSGQWQVCLGSAPTGETVLTGTIDTEHDVRCLQAQPASWYPAQPSSCFIIAGSIRLDTGVTVHVKGRKPLVLLADTTITITGTLDAASHRNGDAGPAAGSSECSGWVSSPGGSGGGSHFGPGGNGAGGGGAGGSFMTKGGDGGTGDNNHADNGQAPTGGNAPAKLRGGCSGQRGYTGGLGPPFGPNSGGAGGGAVYLVAGTSIAIPGQINVSGAGGNGNDQRDGGDGGGSGGMIVLFAPTVTAVTLVANGGGGASGGTTQQNGNDGSDGSVAAVPASGGTPGAGGGGGYALAIEANNGSGAAKDSGGGGGGGGGGYIQSNVVLTGAVCSPPASYTF